MRVKIKGEITPARLVEAFEIAQEKFLAVRPDTRIYGANLYLTAFDEDGLPFDIVDHQGNSLWITLNAEYGQFVRPPLTAEGERRRQEAREEAQKEEEAYEQRIKKAQEEQRRQREEIKKRAIELKRLFKKFNEVTSYYLNSAPESFVRELNEIIKNVWIELDPREESGVNKGQPKKAPEYSLIDGYLFLHSSTWKYPKQLKNPVGRLTFEAIEPFWKSNAWREVTNRTIEFLDKHDVGDAAEEDGHELAAH